MKVWFLIFSETTPSSRIRILDLLHYVKSYGFEAEAEVIPEKYFLRRKFLKKAKNYSIVVLQKKLLSKSDINLLRQNAKILIFDFDDAIDLNNSIPSDNPDDYENRRFLQRFKYTLNSADMVITANSHLYRKVKEINPQILIKIIPSSVSTDCRVKDDYQLNQPAVIGWIGTKSNLRCFKYFAPALLATASKHDIVLRIISDDSIEIPNLNVEFRLWQLATQYEEIRQFDIGIMPLTTDPFSQGKSSYKLLQYMAVGVPAVASAVGMNKELGKNEQNCLLADNVEMFSEKLQLLLTDIELRKKMGMSGRKIVQEKYPREKAGKALADILYQFLDPVILSKTQRCRSNVSKPDNVKIPMIKINNGPENNKFVIVISSYNNQKYYEYNLRSVLNQSYSNYRVLYTDDCSTDGTGELVGGWLLENDRNGLVTLKQKDERVGAMQNIYNMISSCDDDEIIITLDGDDWLAHTHVLSKLDLVYRDKNIWLTYGQYRTYPDGKYGGCRQIPDRVIRRNRIRKWRWCSSHLRSFYTWLFRKIKPEDLMKDGKFYWMTWDMALMLPMLEMAGVHQQFISEVLYIYNMETPINDHKVDRELQKKLEKEIRGKTRYPVLSRR